MATLEEMIEARKKEAKEKKIFYKSLRIVEAFGYTNDDLMIRAYHRNGCHSTLGDSAGESSAEITYYGKIVFQLTNHGIERFIPGEWEKKFEKLAQEAELSIARKELEKIAKKNIEEARLRAQQLEEQRKKFGL